MLYNVEFNPFFYRCLKYYIDTLPFEVRDKGNVLPPLAILHQYQNERIRTQRGVFTILPNYIMNDEMIKYKKIGYDCRILENQNLIQDCLYEVRIIYAAKLAKEPLFSGERTTELYLDNEYYDVKVKTSFDLYDTVVCSANHLKTGSKRSSPDLKENIWALKIQKQGN